MSSSPSWITLGTALKRATEHLYGAIDDVYRRDGVLFQAAWFSVFRALADHGAQPVSTVATRIAQSHAAVSQVSKKLAAAGYVDSATASDRRQRLVALSPRGRALAARLRDVWTEISNGFGAEFGGTHGDLLACVTNLETTLATGALTDTILEHAQAKRARAITLLDFVPEHAAEFQRLNEEWLSASFAIEPVDAALLGDPQAKVIDPGGAIISASLHGELIGTCALLHMGGGVYELSKMAVTEVCRGLGVGKRLLQAAIDRFDLLDGRRLFLESSKKLSPALKLYESFGFGHTPRPGGASPYARADVYMVLQRG